MRRFVILPLALLAVSCAGHRPPRFGGGPPPGDHAGPAGGDNLFVSPMGEPFRVPDPARAWFDGVDADSDGRLSRAEFRTDAARFFALLDRGHDGEIDPADVDYYENTLLPEIRVGGGAGRGRSSGSPPGGGGRGGGGPPGGGPGGRGGEGGGASRSAPVSQGREGAGRYAYLDLPEPVTSTDRNFNRGVDAAEFARAADDRFALLDRNGDGLIDRGELPRVDTHVRGGGGPRDRGRPEGPPPGGRNGE